MTRYDFGDVLLLHAFPYSNPAKVKKRPALVLVDIGDRDIVVGRITSEEPRDSHDLVLAEWKNCGLLLPSTIRLSKIATLGKELVLKKLGKIGSPERRKIRSALKKLFDL
ncbi:MAG: type II toxin-antitoxin system PemK/MazF family toxin [Deltaproteobacteria bacterium]|nr:type II toxin-antitoxin system PemK/MazF family toxin [Deltaproteobacteria bacterium]